MRRALGALVREPPQPRGALVLAAAGPLWAACGWRGAASQALLPQQVCLAHGAPWRHSAAASRGWAAQLLQSAPFASGAGVPRSGVTPPAAVANMSRGGVRVVIVSPNVIAEPYQGPQRWLSPLAFFTPAGWRELGNRLVGRLKSVYTVAKVKKDVPNWSLGSFKTDAIQVYTEICTAIAAGDHASLRHKTTESQLTDIKRELKQRAAGGWKRVAWSLVEVQECSVVHGRLVAPNPKDATNSWAQLTVALKSTQRFAAYDERGKLVAGDPKELLTVQDYWVLERAMVPGLPEGLKRWRCAARMSLPH